MNQEIKKPEIHCKFDVMEDPRQLVGHPRNPNNHGQDQIERLVKLYHYHGIRQPIIVSKRSNYIVAGHGRKLAAIRAGIKEFPVCYQDFDNEDQEYSYLVSDNSIADWADLDFSVINDELKNFDPQFDLDNLGIKDFTLDFADKEFNPTTPEPDKEHKRCPHCGEAL